MVDDIRHAESISGIPRGDCGDEGIHYHVGSPYVRRILGEYAIGGKVTSITVTADLPGLHCNMERVRVFDGETMIFEAPLHSLEGVTYAGPARQ
ncbi:hypothetical protein GA830_10235 [Mesorhizobium sp. NBSH29]|uniref:hypothetical protein n=1 Tax=Mesorhizobium sp. NBSH29 TaxID=2654249 RepID=UPI00189644AA|nr:hypothetical protein [Mesorhizobium sp. NBSH29]QPC87073.1 hypothetical protein GA830_10235 [Mesorhizobium sp. NBSH29]